MHVECILTFQFTYFIDCLFQDNFKNAEIIKNPRSTSKDTCKTIFIILFKLFSIGDSFEFIATR